MSITRSVIMCNRLAHYHGCDMTRRNSKRRVPKQKNLSLTSEYSFYAMRLKFPTRPLHWCTVARVANACCMATLLVGDRQTRVHTSRPKVLTWVQQKEFWHSLSRSSSHMPLHTVLRENRYRRDETVRPRVSLHDMLLVSHR